MLLIILWKMESVIDAKNQDKMATKKGVAMKTKKTGKQVLKSKKFVVYFYEAGNGGSICSTNEKGAMGTGKDSLFGSKKEAMDIFESIVDKYLVK